MAPEVFSKAKIDSDPCGELGTVNVVSFRRRVELGAELRQNWLLIVTCLMCPWALQLLTHILPFIYPRIIDEYGWSREQTTLIASVRYVFGALGALLVGYLSDRVSPWLLLIVCAVITGLAQLWFLTLASLEEYYVIGVLQGICGPGGYTAVMLILARYFVKSLGTVTGVVLIGASLCSIIAPLAITYTMEVWGWRWSVASMTLVVWLVVLPLLLMAGRTKAPLSVENSTSISSATMDPLTPSMDEGKSRAALFRRVFRSRDFMLIAISISFASMADAGFRHHQVFILRDIGITASTVAVIVSSIGAAGIVTRVLAGALLDRLSCKGLGILYMFEAVASVLALVLFIPAVIPLYVILRSFSHAAITLDQSVMARHIFGTNSLGPVIGIFAAIGSFGSAAGPWLMGVIFDSFGSYHYAFILFTILPVLGATLAGMTRPHFWLSQKGVEQNAA